MEEHPSRMSTIEKAAAKLASRGKSALRTGPIQPVSEPVPATPPPPTIMQGKAQGFLNAAEHFCDIYDLTEIATSEPTWTTLADAERDILWWYQAYPQVVGARAVYVDLPAGRTLAIDSLDQHGYDCREHYYTDSETWFMLRCFAQSAPDDRWLSIAETFEFLPAASEPIDT